jgi:hypothetical protein
MCWILERLIKEEKFPTKKLVKITTDNSREKDLFIFNEFLMESKTFAAKCSKFANK